MLPGPAEGGPTEVEAVPVPDMDRWRIPYLQRLLSEKQDHYYSGDVLNEKHTASLIDSLVVN